MESLIKLFSENSTLTVVAFVATILLLVTVLALFFVALQQGREISLWKLTIGKPQKAQYCVPQLTQSDIDKCELRILTPDKGDPVDPSKQFAVSGTYKELPEGFVPWIFTTNTSHPTRWWPQKEVDLDDNKWSGLVYGIGPSPNTGKRYFGVYLVGPDGRALLRFRKELRESSGQSGPLNELTRDIYECQIVRVSVPRQ